MGSEEKNIFFFSFAAVLHRAAPKSDQRGTESGWFNFFLLLSFDFPSSIARQNARTHARRHTHTHTHSNYVGALVASVAQLGSFKEQQQRQSKGSHAKRRDDDVVRAHMYGPARVQSPFLHLSAADSYYMTAARTDYGNPFAIRQFS